MAEKIRKTDAEWQQELTPRAVLCNSTKKAQKRAPSLVKYKRC